MRRMTLTCAAALALASAACGDGNSGNVMAPHANALSPEQVDLALGPENANTGGNELDAANEVNAVNSIDTDNTADSVPPANNSAEQ